MRAKRRVARARLRALIRRSRELDCSPLRDPVEVADVVKCLLVEARRSDEDGGTSLARIAAWVQIGRHLGMFKGSVQGNNQHRVGADPALGEGGAAQPLLPYSPKDP